MNVSPLLVKYHVHRQTPIVNIPIKFENQLAPPRSSGHPPPNFIGNPYQCMVFHDYYQCLLEYSKNGMTCEKSQLLYESCVTLNKNVHIFGNGWVTGPNKHP